MRQWLSAAGACGHYAPAALGGPHRAAAQAHRYTSCADEADRTYKKREAAEAISSEDK